MANSLGLPENVRTTVYRTFVALFRADPTLKATIDPLGWHVWDGSTNDLTEPESGPFPACRITPTTLRAEPLTRTQTLSPLGIVVEVCVNGTNMDDIVDLWGAFEAAIFKGDGGDTIRNAIVAAGVGGHYISTKLHMPAILRENVHDEQGVFQYAYLKAVGEIEPGLTVKL